MSLSIRSFQQCTIQYKRISPGDLNLLSDSDVTSGISIYACLFFFWQAEHFSLKFKFNFRHFWEGLSFLV